MIKVENIETWGFKHAIRGMRNPMNSWEKSDSCICNGEDCEMVLQGYESAVDCNDGAFGYCIGQNDLKLMQSLYAGGTSHRKYLRQIIVSLDITAPLYWWKEFDTYKVGTVANSCSTMHKIQSKVFTLDDFSHEHLNSITNTFWYNADGTSYNCSSFDFMQITCDVLNFWRKMYLSTRDKDHWWQMIQLLPSSYNQKRTVTLSYETVMNILDTRQGHKLDEWRNFCEVLKTLPYITDIRQEVKPNGN